MSEVRAPKDLGAVDADGALELLLRVWKVLDTGARYIMITLMFWLMVIGLLWLAAWLGEKGW